MLLTPNKESCFECKFGDGWHQHLDEIPVEEECLNKCPPKVDKYEIVAQCS